MYVEEFMYSFEFNSVFSLPVNQKEDSASFLMKIFSLLTDK